MKDFRQRAFVGLVGLVSAGLISFGCSSSSNSTGTGGTTGTGTGGSHTGGTTGTGTGGTTAGSGGAGGATTGSACAAYGHGSCAAPVAALISDFSDAVVGAADAGTNAGKITFGSSTTVQGGVVTFQDSVSTAGTATIPSARPSWPVSRRPARRTCTRTTGLWLTSTVRPAPTLTRTRAFRSRSAATRACAASCSHRRLVARQQRQRPA